MAGQTLSELRSLLAAAGLAPRHKYGQNFLIDLNLMRKLAAAAELRATDTVLEVGCGTGSLTEGLLESGAEVVGVEIDRGLQEILRGRLGGHERLTLVFGDVLARKHEINPDVLAALAARPPRAAGHYKLVANLPYQVATPLAMELLHLELGRGRPRRFERLVCTVQREVGERLTAAPNSDAYGPVSVVADTLADVRIIAQLPPRVFWPRPQVDSVMLLIRLKPAGQIEVSDPPSFVRLVRTAFLHRRKMLRKTAEAWAGPDAAAVLAAAGINPHARPEALSPAEWRQLHRRLSRAPHAR